jgi:hypothetical protein
MGGLGYLLGAVQWVLGFVRQAGILVLAALLPLAASGSINESTKPWLNRMLPWLLTLVLYRPMAALIYMIGFTFLGTANDVTTVMTGLMVLVLAVIAMPAMMRFFSWAGVSAGGGGGAVMAGAIGAASLMDAHRTRANKQANYINTTGPGSNNPRPDGAAPTGGPSTTQPGPNGGPGTPGAAGKQATPGADTASRTAGAGSPAAGPASKGAAAAGPAGAALAAGAVATQWTRQAAHGAAENMTGGGDDQK